MNQNDISRINPEYIEDIRCENNVYVYIGDGHITGVVNIPDSCSPIVDHESIGSDYTDTENDMSFHIDKNYMNEILPLLFVDGKPAFLEDAVDYSFGVYVDKFGSCIDKETETSLKDSIKNSLKKSMEKEIFLSFETIITFMHMLEYDCDKVVEIFKEYLARKK